MKTFFADLVIGFNYFVLFHYGFVNLIYTILLVISTVAILRHILRIRYAPFKDFVVSPETLPVSIIVPAHNEENVIARTVKATLEMNYPYFEVIVINDGSTDRTLDTLIQTFQLRKVDRAYRNVLKTAPIRGFYFSPEIPNLLVLDKENSGKADSLNCGINISSAPYFCTVDADSVLEENALIKLMIPVMESAAPVVACGGVIRTLNGVGIENDRVSEIDLPKNRLAMFQVAEYIRAFLFGRVGLNVVNSILILSGAFSLFRRDAIVDVGGYRQDNVSEDMELVTRLHRVSIEKNTPYSIKFISDPVCWTEVPETMSMLARQRRRWYQGLLQTMIQNRDILFKPKYGRLGWICLPYYLIVELLSPLVEMLGYIVVPISWMLGMLNTEFMILFLTLSVFYGIFLSSASIYLEEVTYRRYPKWNHLARLLLYGVLENFGYRQINSFWRFQAFLKYVMGERKWEYVRKGKRKPQRPEGVSSS